MPRIPLEEEIRRYQYPVGCGPECRLCNPTPYTTPRTTRNSPPSPSRSLSPGGWTSTEPRSSSTSPEPVTNQGTAGNRISERPDTTSTAALRWGGQLPRVTSNATGWSTATQNYTFEPFWQRDYLWYGGRDKRDPVKWWGDFINAWKNIAKAHTEKVSPFLKDFEEEKPATGDFDSLELIMAFRGGMVVKVDRV
jgi:hypothetical protein